MKVLFLDIDGVIMLDHIELDAGCLARLKNICEQTGAVIVLSSDWRLYTDSFEFLKSEFRRYGVPDIHAITMDLDADRYVEIQQWLGENPQVTKYAIVDDRSRAAIPDEPHTFFRTQYCTKGLNAETEAAIIKHLGTNV